MKEALGKLIVTENLTFSFIESKAFVDLLKLVNPDCELFLVKADAITEYVMSKFGSERGKITEMFKTVYSKVSLTTDAWTSPKF